ncbi:hypothetical protein B4U79_03471 [Dinothrombium tinctorium]|uniref:Uncharacterized protein n=1 Tax=Dinothrombium tinctorium TaxID=1965070 RepID=A0A3S3PTI5_9ACAR|nr:hypothetical protein B4U79_01491 [Dinothrombium tinctorium]RWS16089.1 hypothetical protein B4U79_03471 [Dinothrombium tinctorium]
MFGNIDKLRLRIGINRYLSGL